MRPGLLTCQTIEGDLSLATPSKPMPHPGLGHSHRIMLLANVFNQNANKLQLSGDFSRLGSDATHVGFRPVRWFSLACGQPGN